MENQKKVPEAKVRVKEKQQKNMEKDQKTCKGKNEETEKEQKGSGSALHHTCLVALVPHAAGARSSAPRIQPPAPLTHAVCSLRKWHPGNTYFPLH